MHVLDQPLRTSGEMAWLGPGHLQRRVTMPAFEQVDIQGDQVALQRQGHGVRHFSLRRAPGLQLMLQSFNALLAGNYQQLQDAFELSLQTRSRQGWTLQLTPRDDSLRRDMSRISIDGEGRQLRCMRIDAAGGDRSVELFGALAANLPDPVRIEDLQHRCQAAG